MTRENTKKLTLSAMFFALGIVLPFLIGQIPAIGKMLSPMHIPVLFCGLIVGWKYGLIVGFLLPLVRSVLFGMPALFPSATGMAFELGTYGFVIALVYSRFPRKNTMAVYISLITAMLAGRIRMGNCAGYYVRSNRWGFYIPGFYYHSFCEFYSSNYSSAYFNSGSNGFSG